MPALPQSLALFPCCVSASSWPANVLTAHDMLSDIYYHALQVLNQEDADPLQLIFHLGAIDSDAIPLLQAIADDPVGNELQDWLKHTVALMGNIFIALSDYHNNNVQNRSSWTPHEDRKCRIPSGGSLKHMTDQVH
ncbi:hypothetical protein PISMIDRAFT_25874 [Pisolithus microcarpus 441]|uniref:Uncharacterized protein n=1 Tax=Pisolithus microcarpus 441 TaxID=765257 RepID=A0A0C9XEN6_9AGAM|nr:hypothetical protein BKA83DRAFT_25874 [Pisolithus microcarpus]KIK10765.1 hypothetical protein PISMIDRAFT_25874 [Pisolithus microcarpus 441]